MHHKRHPGADGGKWPWPRPSERIRDLLRQGAETALRSAPEWINEIDSATLSSDHMREVAGDPALAAATRRTNRDNLLYWAAANIRDPGAPVPANVGPEPIGVARDLVRRGLGESTLNAYRTGQNAAWLRWMAIVFELTSDPDELRELLDISARSISLYVDATIAEISAQMTAERDELMRGTHAERREVVALLLDGAPISARSASHRLGYELVQSHRAAAIWSDAADTDLSVLERGAEALADALGAPRPLVVMASAASLWAWIPRGGEIDRDKLRVTIDALPGVRIALGSRGSGIEGFRRSHFDAITTQRMLARVGSDARIATFDDVRLASLVTHAGDEANEFVAHTLGELATAPAELRGTLLSFLTEGCNASRAAKRLCTHRNTLLRRVARAEELLPRPIERNRIQVAVALEVLRWQQPDA
jgi:DNA-binding PucR family transcriptional regulator